MLQGLLIVLVATVAEVTSDARGDGVPTVADLASYVDQLRSDDKRWNALDAHRKLITAGLAAVPTLESALASEDYQQRQLAADCLRRIAAYTPSDLMLRVCVEGLRDDNQPSNQHANGSPAYTSVFNAASGLQYLIRYADRTEKILVEAQETDDAQQRFLAALCLSFGGRTPTPERTARILMVHLRDNTIHGDAILASGALRRMDLVALPSLLARRDSAEGQELDLINLLIAHALRKPQREIDERIQRIGDIGWPVSRDPTDVDSSQWRAVNIVWHDVQWADVRHE